MVTTMMIYAVCGTLSAAGLWLALLVARRRRYAAALRTAAIALVPLGLALTSVVDFVVHMTLDPVAWAGFGVLALALVFYLVGGFVDARARPGPEPRRTPAPPRAAAPALPSGREPSGGKAGPEQQRAAAGGGEDYSEIEEILKKHGI